MTKLLSIPPQLMKAVREQRCVLFLGAGVSVNAGLPSGKEVSNLLATELRPDFEKHPEYSQKIGELEEKRSDLKATAQTYEDFYKGGRVYDTVAELLATKEREAQESGKTKILDPLKYLPSIKEILTTNYDLIVENVLDPSDCHVIYRTEDLRQSNTPKRKLIKLHGTRHDPRSMVLTRQDYHQYLETHEAIVDLTKKLLRQNVLVLVGYSLEDDNFGQIYEKVHSDDKDGVQNFFVSPDASLYQSLHWESRGFQHVPLTAEDFFRALKEEFAAQHYKEETASFPERKDVVVEPLFNPFVLYDTEALVEQKPKFLFGTFVSPVGFPTILEHQHTFIEGHRGSGKSTILWRLSMKSLAFDQTLDLPMWGFYIKMVPGLFTAFRRKRNNDDQWVESDDEWLKYFIHYFNLIALSGIIQNIEEAVALNVLRTSKNLNDAVNRIATKLLRLEDSKHVKHLRQLRLAIDEELDTVVNERSSRPFYTSVTLITRALDVLTEGVIDLKKKVWHILLDEYDNVYPEQQAVINVLLRERNQKVRYKIAVKTLHAYLKDLDGKSLDMPDDYGYVSCDSTIWDTDLKPKYFSFLEELSHQRLNKSGHDNIKIRDLLPVGKEKRDYYAGFEAYCYLSSGLTRLYLELCKDAVYEAYPDSTKAPVELGPIPVSIQDHVAKIHSAILFKSYRTTKDPQKVLRLFRVFGPLFRGIAKVTAKQKEDRRPLSFEVGDLDQLSVESLEILDDAVKSRMLQVPILPKQPHNPIKDSPAEKYSFHRLIAPFFRLALTERYAVPIKAKDFNRIWSHPDEVRELLADGYKAKGISEYIDSADVMLPFSSQE
jgi:NAD-dependent SIR2 family protein deacetylase